MNWRESIHQLTDSAGWRRHAPAAGSVLAHIAVVSVLASLMAAVTAEDAPARTSPSRVMSVELVQLPERPVEAGVTPPPRTKAETTPERSVPTLPVSSANTRKTNAPTASTPSDSGGADDNTFYVPSAPDAPTGVAKSLASLMGDECAKRLGPRSKECAGRELAKRTGPMDSVMPRTKEELEKYYAAFTPDCAMRVGCEGGEWVSSIGTRGVGKPPPGSRDDHGGGSMMAGGAASVAGPNTIVGRLGFNREHTDPGFGD